MIVVLKKIHTQKYTFQKYKFLAILGWLHVWYLYMFHEFSNFYIKFRTCILSLILCYFTLKPIQNLFKILQNPKICLNPILGHSSRP